MSKKEQVVGATTEYTERCKQYKDQEMFLIAPGTDFDGMHGYNINEKADGRIVFWSPWHGIELTFQADESSPVQACLLSSPQKQEEYARGRRQVVTIYNTKGEIRQVMGKAAEAAIQAHRQMQVTGSASDDVSIMEGKYAENLSSRQIQAGYHVLFDPALQEANVRIAQRKSTLTLSSELREGGVRLKRYVSRAGVSRSIMRQIAMKGQGKISQSSGRMDVEVFNGSGSFDPKKKPSITDMHISYVDPRILVHRRCQERRFSQLPQLRDVLDPSQADLMKQQVIIKAFVDHADEVRFDSTDRRAEDIFLRIRLVYPSLDANTIRSFLQENFVSVYSHDAPDEDYPSTTADGIDYSPRKKKNIIRFKGAYQDTTSWITGEVESIIACFDALAHEPMSPEGRYVLYQQLQRQGVDLPPFSDLDNPAQKKIVYDTAFAGSWPPRPEAKSKNLLLLQLLFPTVQVDIMDVAISPIPSGDKPISEELLGGQPKTHPLFLTVAQTPDALFNYLADKSRQKVSDAQRQAMHKRVSLSWSRMEKFKYMDLPESKLKMVMVVCKAYKAHEPIMYFKTLQAAYPSLSLGQLEAKFREVVSDHREYRDYTTSRGYYSVLVPDDVIQPEADAFKAALDEMVLQQVRENRLAEAEERNKLTRRVFELIPPGRHPSSNWGKPLSVWYWRHGDGSPTKPIKWRGFDGAISRILSARLLSEEGQERAYILAWTRGNPEYRLVHRCEPGGLMVNGENEVYYYRQDNLLSGSSREMKHESIDVGDPRYMKEWLRQQAPSLPGDAFNALWERFFSLDQGLEALSADKWLQVIEPEFKRANAKQEKAGQYPKDLTDVFESQLAASLVFKQRQASFGKALSAVKGDKRLLKEFKKGAAYSEHRDYLAEAILRGERSATEALLLQKFVGDSLSAPVSGNLYEDVFEDIFRQVNPKAKKGRSWERYPKAVVEQALARAVVRWVPPANSDEREESLSLLIDNVVALLRNRAGNNRKAQCHGVVRMRMAPPRSPKRSFGFVRDGVHSKAGFASEEFQKLCQEITEKLISLYTDVASEELEKSGAARQRFGESLRYAFWLHGNGSLRKPLNWRAYAGFENNLIRDQLESGGSRLAEADGFYLRSGKSGRESIRYFCALSQPRARVVAGNTSQCRYEQINILNGSRREIDIRDVTPKDSCYLEVWLKAIAPKLTGDSVAELMFEKFTPEFVGSLTIESWEELEAEFAAASQDNNRLIVEDLTKALSHKLQDPLTLEQIHAFTADVYRIETAGQLEPYLYCLPRYSADSPLYQKVFSTSPMTRKAVTSVIPVEESDFRQILRESLVQLRFKGVVDTSNTSRVFDEKLQEFCEDNKLTSTSASARLIFIELIDSWLGSLSNAEIEAGIEAVAEHYTQYAASYMSHRLNMLSAGADASHGTSDSCPSKKAEPSRTTTGMATPLSGVSIVRPPRLTEIERAILGLKTEIALLKAEYQKGEASDSKQLKIKFLVAVSTAVSGENLDEACRSSRSISEILEVFRLSTSGNSVTLGGQCFNKEEIMVSILGSGSKNCMHIFKRFRSVCTLYVKEQERKEMPCSS